MMRWWRAVGSYADAPDPPMRVANLVALCVVGNQPLYPLYVAWILGRWDWWVLATWLSTPFFALVPRAGRRDPAAGKLLLCLAGIGNTTLSMLLLGAHSGVGLFFLPCALLCVLLLERWLGSLLVLVIGLIVIGLDDSAFASLPQLFRLNAFSVTTLSGFILLLSYRARRPEAAAQ